MQILQEQLLSAAIRCSSAITSWPMETYDASSGGKTMTNGDTTTIATSVPGEIKSVHYFAETFISLQWERQYPRSRYLDLFGSSIGKGTS